MADENKHKHQDNDIIIRDQDGTYKILREGKFVPLDEVKDAPSAGDVGPKRAPDAKPASQPMQPRAMASAPAAPGRPAAPSMPSTPAVPAKPAAQSAQPVISRPQPPQPAPQPSTPPVRGMADQELLAKADVIINKSGITFASGEVRGRVAKALVAHLKQVRKPFETRQNLMKDIRDGGAGLSEQDVAGIMQAAGTAPEQPSNGVRPVTKPENPISKPMTSTMAPVGKEIGMPAKVALDKAAAADVPYFPISPQASKQAFSLPSAAAPRPMLSDIQKPSRPIGGPVDELAYDLATWRRLAPNPADRVKKIEANLDLLEQDGYAQRLRGIQAWRSSDVMKAYLLAAKQSLEDSKPMQEMLGGGGASQLSWDEWQAVAELNERITA